MNIPYRTGWLFFRILSKLLFRVRVSGRENLPGSGGFILASNHRSYFDPPLLGCWVRREIYFFAKKELFDHRLTGAVLRRVKARPVRRGTIDRQALRIAIETVKRGQGLAVFPEGTRSKTVDLLAPRLGVGVIARQAGCPIVPAYLSGTDKLKECLKGRRRLSVVYGEPLPAAWVASQPANKKGYTAIAEAVMARIGQLGESLSVGESYVRTGFRTTKK